MAELVKTCSRCKRELPLINFYKRSDSPVGAVAWCKPCHFIVKRKYRMKYRTSLKGRLSNRRCTKRHAIRKRQAAGSRTALTASQASAWKEQQLARQRNRCYWRFPVCTASNRFTLAHPPVEDHVIPLFHGGRDDLSNLVLACLNCNSAKSAQKLTLV